MEKVIDRPFNYENIVVGELYHAPKNSFLYGNVEVTEIRYWSDGLKDVMLTELETRIALSVRLDTLLGNDEKGDPILRKVETDQE